MSSRNKKAPKDVGGRKWLCEEWKCELDQIIANSFTNYFFEFCQSQFQKLVFTMLFPPLGTLLASQTMLLLP